MEAVKTRIQAVYRFERACRRDGLTGIAGVDEAGRGPLAGPVVAACVLLPDAAPRKLKGLTDSKKLTAAARDAYFDVIQEVAIGVGIGLATPAEIDEINILQATFLAMRRALEGTPGARHLLVDGNLVIPGVPHTQLAIVGGDGKSWSIAAASVIAKVTRDRAMVALDEACPGYGFSRHKGYGTAVHQEALRRLGPSEHHRRSFLRGLLAGAAEGGPNPPVL
jgi:ribonuclease HII